MSLGLPRGGVNEFLWAVSSHPTTRPNNTTFGTAVTPGQNTMGSYVEVLNGSVVTDDVWFISIRATYNSPLGSASRDTLLRVGYDPANGAPPTYSTLIEYLGCGPVGGMGQANAMTGPASWGFPLYIPAGSSIGVQAQVNNATVGTLYIWIKLWGRPTRPDLCSRGTFVRSFGYATGTSKGTDVTLGTTSEGSWTSFGTTADDLWWWQLSTGCTDATYGAGDPATAWDVAIGDASNKREILTYFGDVHENSNESLGYFPPRLYPCVALAKSGITMYVRGQCNGTADSNNWAIVHGLGGLA